MNILNPREVVGKIGLSRVTLWRLEKSGQFPKRIKLTNHRVGWIESEVTEWIDSRPRVGGNSEPVAQGDKK
jgi:prophage regulatory protein